MNNWVFLAMPGFLYKKKGGANLPLYSVSSKEYCLQVAPRQSLCPLPLCYNKDKLLNKIEI
jgi:hypothetical protein